MNQFYSGAEDSKPKKRLILLVALFLVVAATTAYFFISSEEPLTDDETGAYAYIFRDYVRAGRYDSAYKMLSNPQLNEQEFSSNMTDVKDSVNLATCKITSVSSPDVMLGCSYKSQDTENTVEIKFTMTKNNNKILIDSFDISNN